MSCADDLMPFLQYVLTQEANVMSCESESHALHRVTADVNLMPCNTVSYALQSVSYDAQGESYALR